MRATPNLHVEKYRVRSGPLASSRADGNNGCFEVPCGPPGTAKRVHLVIIASDGMGFDHVSVHVRDEPRCPTWPEVCFVKELFWLPEETALQYHPPASGYVNNHPTTLHVWRQQGVEIPLPPRECV